MVEVVLRDGVPVRTGDQFGLGRVTDRWESAIRAFEEQDRREPPPTGTNVFVGSSSIRLWKLADSFPDHAFVNRGFGGSHLADSVRHADRIVTPYKPRVVVVYAGDNDLAAGKSPETVRDDYRQFVDRVRTKLPDATIVYISIKPAHCAGSWRTRPARPTG
jgi:lysophospholipase L1-like esterase